MQTKYKEKLQARNKAIIADYKQIRNDEPKVSRWLIATSLSKRYKITPNMIVKIIKESNQSDE